MVGAAVLLIDRSAPGAATVTLALLALLAELGSVGDVAFTRVVLTMTVPGDVVDLTWATRVIEAEAPEASEVKLTVRLLTKPPQLPPPVALQETKLVVVGRVSVTVTDCAALGPPLASAME